MRLVFLYGPPAVGKLTVGRELAGLTGFKLFHNHLTVDPVQAVFPFGSAPFGRLVRRFRREVFAEAAAAGIDVVFTYVYSSPDDDESVRELIEPVESCGGTVLFVQLACPRDVLLARVPHESRRMHGKLVEPASFGDLLDSLDLFSAIPFVQSLRIDTDATSPTEAAAQIVAHYSLPRLVRGIHETSSA